MLFRSYLINSTGDKVNITPTTTNNFTLSTIESKDYWVNMSDFCNSDGINDFEVKVTI